MNGNTLSVCSVHCAKTYRPCERKRCKHSECSFPLKQMRWQSKQTRIAMRKRNNNYNNTKRCIVCCDNHQTMLNRISCNFQYARCIAQFNGSKTRLNLIHFHHEINLNYAENENLAKMASCFNFPLFLFLSQNFIELDENSIWRKIAQIRCKFGHFVWLSYAIARLNSIPFFVKCGLEAENEWKSKRTQNMFATTATETGS